MLHFLAFLAVSAGANAVDCSAFAAQASLPIETLITPISAQELDPAARPIKSDESWREPTFQIGKLVYQGSGFRYRSTDNRFRAVAESIAELRTTICQYQPILSSSYNGRGKPLGRGAITFYRPSQPSDDPPGLTAAARAGVLPFLAKYSALASWPLFTTKGQIFVGLMRPTDRTSSGPNLIVAYPAKSGPTPVHIIAKIKGPFSSLSITPSLHSSGVSFWLTGLDADGSLIQVAFWMDGQTVDELPTGLAN